VIVGASSVVAAMVLLAAPGSGTYAVLAGIPLALILPGYALTRAVFRDRLRSAADYVLLSLGLSLSVTILGGLALNELWPSAHPLSSHSWAVLLSAVTVGCCLVAHMDGNVGPRLQRRLPRPRAVDVAVLGAALAIGGGAVGLASAPLPPPPGVSGYTQMWLVPQARSAQLGVRSDELEPTRYQLRLELNGRLYRTWQLRLRPGESWATELPVDPSARPRPLAEAALYRRSNLHTPYRRVRIVLGRSA
jgi:uncharacterized membrane protein